MKLLQAVKKRRCEEQRRLRERAKWSKETVILPHVPTSFWGGKKTNVWNVWGACMKIMH